MSVVFSGLNSGRFVSTGTQKLLSLPSGADNMWVLNETIANAVPGAVAGAQFYWQRGMTQGQGLEYQKQAITGAIAPIQIAAGAGFYLYDSSINTPGPSLGLTGVTGAVPPVVNTANTASLNNGDIVRMYNTVGGLQLASMDFTIGAINAGVSFELAFMRAIVNANPGAGIFRRIPYDAYFYPSHRYITKISQAANAIVTLSVTHGYVVGQKIRFIMPTVTGLAFGMTELNEVQATILAVGAADANGITNTITIDVDTTGFTAFAFPLTVNYPFTPAQVVPVGENTAAALAAVPQANILSDATENVATRGLLLKAGADSPAGVAGNVIYWVAGKSFNGI